MTVQPLLLREELGPTLRSLRTEQGLSLRDLAADLDMTAQGISRIELGQRSPKVETLVKLAHGLGVEFQIGGNGDDSIALVRE